MIGRRGRVAVAARRPMHAGSIPRGAIGHTGAHEIVGAAARRVRERLVGLGQRGEARGGVGCAVDVGMHPAGPLAVGAANLGGAGGGGETEDGVVVCGGLWRARDHNSIVTLAAE